MTPPQSDLTSEPPTYLGGQLSALRQRIETSNTPGNRDGLLARHILHDVSDITWHVDPFSGTWLKDNTYRLEDPGPLAVLGYGLSTNAAKRGEVTAVVCSGLRRLMRRNLLPGDRANVLHDMTILLGVCLAAEAVQADVPEFRPWLQETLDGQRLRPADRLHELIQHHVHAKLSGEPITLTTPGILARNDALAMVCWMLNQGTATLSNPLDGARELRKRTMQAAFRADPANVPVPQVALLLHAADNILSTSIDQMVLSRSHVSTVLRRFEAAMRRWRWDSDDLQHPIRWEVRSEREVQDILWIMLRSVFDDVVDEDPLPKIGHSSYRADFGVPSLGVLVEAKYAYKAADFKKIEHEVMVDAVTYLKDNERYREIIVFIYDESRSVEHHDVTERALLDLDGVSDVIIVSRPGVLPAPKRAPAMSKGKRTPK